MIRLQPPVRSWLRCTSQVLLRFLGRLDENAILARRQEASEKRQGTKSREANGIRATNIARLRELLSVPPVVAEDAEEEASSDDQRQLPCPCPRCRGRMIIIETFAAGMQPTSSPAPTSTPIRSGGGSPSHYQLSLCSHSCLTLHFRAADIAAAI